MGEAIFAKINRSNLSLQTSRVDRDTFLLLQEFLWFRRRRGLALRLIFWVAKGALQQSFSVRVPLATVAISQLYLQESPVSPELPGGVVFFFSRRFGKYYMNPRIKCA